MGLGTSRGFHGIIFCYRDACAQDVVTVCPTGFVLSVRVLALGVALLVGCVRRAGLGHHILIRLIQLAVSRLMGACCVLKCFIRADVEWTRHMGLARVRTLCCTLDATCQHSTRHADAVVGGQYTELCICALGRLGPHLGPWAQVGPCRLVNI